VARTADKEVQIEIKNDKVKPPTHNMYSNTEEVNELDPEPVDKVGRVTVAVKPDAHIAKDHSPRRGAFNKHFKGQEGVGVQHQHQQPTRIRDQAGTVTGTGSPNANRGLDQGVFRITFNQGNVRITKRDLRECSKPLEDFLDDNIDKLVEETCRENNEDGILPIQKEQD